MGAGGSVEADAEAWWAAVTRACATLAAAVALEEVQAVGVVGQAPTAVLVDAEGRVLRPAILWLDVRAAAEASAIEQAVGAGRAEAAFGNRLHPYYLGPKLAWLLRHDPGSMARTRWILQSHAFVVMRLAGVSTCDPSTAMLSTPLFDPASGGWSVEGARAVGIAPGLLPRVVPADQVVGTVTADAAAVTGLRPGTPVVAGGGDFAASALGAGVVEEGQACLMLGTAGNLLVPMREPRFDARLINSHHVGVDRWLALGGTLCGAALEWFRGACAAGAEWTELEREVASVPVGAGGVVMLPYLQGERTPVWDEKARGVFAGIDLSHGRGHLYRALVEGIALGFRDCLSVVTERGVKVGEVIACNGAGRSAVLRQALADALEVPVVWAADSDATVAGAARLAAAGVGAGWQAGSAARVRHEPDPSASARLREVLATRRTLYASLRGDLS
jgi:xylulokinase